MFQSFISKLLKKTIRWRYSRTPLWGKRGKKSLFFKIICSRYCTRRNLCFNFENSQWPKTAQATIDLWSRPRINPPPTYFVSSKATVNVGDGLENIRWIRGLGGEKLLAASYALLPNLKNSLFLAIGVGSRFFRLFSTQQRPNVFVSDAWPTPAISHRPFREHCYPWSRVRRYIDTCRGCMCALVAVCWLTPAYWLCCASSLLKPGNTTYPCPVSEARAPACPTHG